MSVSIDNNDLKAVKFRMKVISKRVQNPTPAWRKVGSYLAAANRKQFATEGAYYGKPWRPLKPDYLQWKIKSGYSRKTLVRTGAMRASFVSRPMDIEQYRGKTAVFGSDHPLAKFHHYGTQRNGKRVNPPRPIMVKTRKTVSDVTSIVQNYIVGNKVSIRTYL